MSETQNLSEPGRWSGAALAAEVTGAARAPGVERVYLPGELASERRAAAARDGVALDPGTVDALRAAGVAWPDSSHPGGDR